MGFLSDTRRRILDALVILMDHGLTDQEIADMGRAVGSSLHLELGHFVNPEDLVGVIRELLEGINATVPRK